MINLLPYTERISLKSLYKRRLFVVGIFIISFALIPLALVLFVLAYSHYSNYQILELQLKSLNATYESSGVANLTNEIKAANVIIQSMRSDFANSKNVSDDLGSILSLRPSDVRITGVVYSKKENFSIVRISGISGTRDSIIQYGTLLDIKNGGLCSEVSVPITTYTKRVEVPFDISCTIQYEKK